MIFRIIFMEVLKECPNVQVYAANAADAGIPR